MRTAPTHLDGSCDMDERIWWDLWNSSYRAKDNNDPTSSELFARTAALVNEITAKEAKTILEIGCGTGTLSRMLCHSGYHGIDISQSAVDIANKGLFDTKGNNGMTYEVADFHEWQLPARRFGVVVCVDAVAYFRHQEFAVAKMAQSLQPGGKLIMTTINPFVYRRIRRTVSSPLREGSVSHWLPRRELHSLIKSAGLKIEHSFTIMPRGNMGLLRLVNSHRLNTALGPRVEMGLKKLKERLGLGQYRVVIASKDRLALN
jgi:2-polyprenyl-3-methyl-5-hydroxy-6-metoxy-1,4-benzoquinol methylase